MRNVFRVLVGSLLLLLPFALVTAALAAPDAADPPTITIVAKDFSFDAPSQVPAGPVAFVLRNEGKEAHLAQFARLKSGKTIQDLESALKNPDPSAAFGIVDFAGGAPEAAPGQTTTPVVLDMQPGSYAMICFISSPDGTPHYAKGMVMPFTVTANGQPATPPAATVSAAMHEYAFDIAGNIKPGQQMWKVTNTGEEPHEMQVFRLQSGKTPEDVQAYLKLSEAQQQATPPPADPFSGIQAMSPGGTGWFTMNLTPATYVALCFVPDDKTGQPHAAMGMVKFFDVTATGGSVLNVGGTSSGSASGSSGSAPQTLPVTGGNGQTLAWLALASGAAVTAAGLAARRLASVREK